MVHRLALFTGLVGAAGVIALALYLGNLATTGPTTPTAVQSAEQPVSVDKVKTVYDNVYVKPTPKPQAARPDRAPNNVATTREPREGRERGDRREGRRERSRGGDD